MTQARLSRTSSAIAQMAAYSIALRNRGIPAIVEPERTLKEYLEGVRALGNRTPRQAQRSSDSLIELYRKEWRSVAPEFARLGRRAVRVLCGDPDTTDDPTFIRHLISSNLLAESRWLPERLLDSYDVGWSEERARSLAPLVTKALTPLRRKSRKAEAFLAHPGLLSVKAPEVIAEAAVKGNLGPAELAERFHLAVDGKLLSRSTNAIGPIWERKIQAARTEGERRSLAEFGYAIFVEPVLVDATTRAWAINTMIIAPKTTETDVIDWLRSTIVRSRQLGDPRKPANKNNWSLIEEKARKRFVQWLAGEDLRFFFEAVMQNTPDPHGRREFWSAWLEDPRLVDSAIALSSRDAYFLRSQGLITRDLHFSKLTSPSDDVSAFLLRFQTRTADVIAIEFSRAGNAACFHDGGDFESVYGDLHRMTFRITDLKNTNTELSPPPEFGTTWDWHREGWEYKFRQALSFFLR